MEILILLLLYCLSQNPDFSESVKPLMSQLKNSEQMLGFLKDLSNFTQTFSTFQSPSNSASANCDPPNQMDKTKEPKEAKEADADEKKAPQSPTSGIANAFIQEILESYLKKH